MKQGLTDHSTVTLLTSTMFLNSGSDVRLLALPGDSTSSIPLRGSSLVDTNVSQ